MGSFKDRDYDSKLGLEPWQSGIFGFYKPGASDASDGWGDPAAKQKYQENRPGITEIAPKRSCLFVVAWMFVHVGPSMSQQTQPSLCLKRLIRQVNGLPGKFPARK